MKKTMHSKTAGYILATLGGVVMACSVAYGIYFLVSDITTRLAIAFVLLGTGIYLVVQSRITLSPTHQIDATKAHGKSNSCRHKNRPRRRKKNREKRESDETKGK